MRPTRHGFPLLVSIFQRKGGKVFPPFLSALSSSLVWRQVLSTSQPGGWTGGAQRREGRLSVFLGRV